MAGKKISKKRMELRERLDPGSGDIVWPQPEESGWSKLPRTTAIILAIMGEKQINGERDLTGTYLDLCDRNMGEGIVELEDEKVHACIAGFSADRGGRSWRERMDRLAQLGFIKIFAHGPRKYARVIIVHPHIAIRKLHEKSLVPEELWELLVARAEQMGCDMTKLIESTETTPAKVIPISK